MKYRKDWYTTTEAITPNDWLCAVNANSEFYDYARQLKYPHDILQTFRDAMNLLQYADLWPDGHKSPLRKHNLKLLFEDAETILSSKKNSERELKIVNQYRTYFKII